jgi:hypothetical protein
VLIAREAVGGGDFGDDGHRAILSRPHVLTLEAPFGQSQAACAHD